MARRGGFSPSLDPFGSGRGGLGRYNITGDTISSLAQTEAYAVAVAWANGAATDEQYLESLRKLLALETPGESGYVTAKNKLDDAVYSIGRNKVVGKVNNATSTADRVAALKELLAYDKAHLATMTAVDSQAYRSQQERVASTRVDIRQSRYSDMVEKVNRGKATTAQLLELARDLKAEAGGDPDVDDWTKTIDDLRERVADEKLSDGFQAYQHKRKTGASLLAEIDARIGELTPGSPAYRQLKAQREDLAQRLKDEARSISDQKVAGQRASGTISDQKYLAYLKQAYEAETPGTAEAIAAGNRLRDYTFSLAEDKLRYDVQHKKRPIGDLIRFYKSYQHGMNPGSERWRQLQNAIESLGGRGGSGGGRGGSSGGGKGITLGPKILGGPMALADFLTGGNGQKIKAPPGFADLFRIDVTKTTSKRWWDNNLRSMTDAFQDGAGTWTYYDQRGNAYELPFVPSLMGDMDAMNLTYARIGLARARNAKEAQTWVGRIITATKSLEQHGATLTMDVYKRAFGDIEKAKQRALAGGRYGEYSNLVRQQADLARLVMGIPDGAPLDAANATNPYLTADQKGRITNDLAKIAPRNTVEDSPFYNPSGDKVLGAIASGAIQTEADPETGEIIAASLDPRRGYLSQSAEGDIGLVLIDEATNPDAFRLDELSGTTVPRYRDENVQVTVRIDGQDVAVWQPVAYQGGGVAAGVSVWQMDPGSNGTGSFQFNPLAGRIGSDPRPASYKVIQNPTNGRQATMPLKQTFTVERTTVNGRAIDQTVQWVSTDGETWYRLTPGAVAPRLVVDSSVAMSDDGKWLINGKEAAPEAVLAKTHVWGGQDALAAGAAAGPAFGFGAPGATIQSRKRTLSGGFDFRPEYMIDSEENDALFEAMRDPGRKRTTSSPNEDLAEEDRWTSYSEIAAVRNAPPLGEVYGPPTPNRRGLPDIAVLDRRREERYTSGEVLPAALRVTDRNSERLDPINLGVKPIPSPTLNIPKTAALAPVAANLALAAVKAVKLKAPKPLLKLTPVQKAADQRKKKSIPAPPKNAAGGYSQTTTQKDDVYTPPVNTGGGGTMKKL